MSRLVQNSTRTHAQHTRTHINTHARTNTHTHTRTRTRTRTTHTHTHTHNTHIHNAYTHSPIHPTHTHIHTHKHAHTNVAKLINLIYSRARVDVITPSLCMADGALLVSRSIISVAQVFLHTHCVSTHSRAPVSVCQIAIWQLCDFLCWTLPMCQMRASGEMCGTVAVLEFNNPIQSINQSIDRSSSVTMKSRL